MFIVLFSLFYLFLFSLTFVGALKKTNSKLSQLATMPPPVAVPQTTAIVVESKMLKDDTPVKIQKMSYSTRGF